VPREVKLAGRVSAGHRVEVPQICSNARRMADGSFWASILIDTARAKVSFAFDLSRRLARFFSGVFLVNEVFIYRVDYMTQELPLVLIGGFSDLNDGSEKVYTNDKHMRQISANEFERGRSISYRSADRNCLSYVNNGRVGGHIGQGMSYPDDVPVDERGISACAIPIRVGGALWGVVEFVSFLPNHFPKIVRAQVEEVSALLSSAFNIRTLLESLNKLEDAVYVGAASTTERMDTLCRLLTVLFQCNTAATVAFEKVEGVYHHPRVLGAYNRPSLTSAVSHSREVDGGSERIYRQFLEDDEDLWYAEFGSQKFEERYGEATHSLWPETNRIGTVCLFRLSDSYQANWAGVLEISIPMPIAADQGWEGTYTSIARLVSRVIRNIRSEISWEREGRRSLSPNTSGLVARLPVR
jgi:hypothetical protein